MASPRLSVSLLAELYDREEDTYRLALRDAERIRSGPPAAALRAVAGHASAALDDLRVRAKERCIRLGSPRALLLDTLRRLGDAAVDPFLDHEQAYRRALAALHRSIDLVRLMHAAASDEGDDPLADWCARWLHARERLAADAAAELGWFGRHPLFARLATPH